MNEPEKKKPLLGLAAIVLSLIPFIGLGSAIIIFRKSHEGTNDWMYARIGICIGLLSSILGFIIMNFVINILLLANGIIAPRK